MRRILATVVLAVCSVICLPGPAHAGGPTSVIITRPGADAGALYVSDAAYEALLALLPAAETRGTPGTPGGGVDYNLTWLVHDVMPWRFDRVRIASDGSAWVSTTFSTDAVGGSETDGTEAVGGWEPLGAAEELAALLTEVLDESAAPAVVTLPAEPTRTVLPQAGTEVPQAPWFSLTGWRWLVPGALLGLAVGAVAARRPRDTEPRQVLISSEA